MWKENVTSASTQSIDISAGIIAMDCHIRKFYKYVHFVSLPLSYQSGIRVYQLNKHLKGTGKKKKHEENLDAPEKSYDPPFN